MTSKGGVVVIVLAATAAGVHAEPAGAQAEVLFRKGRELIAAGHVAEACAAFEQSQKLEPAVSTLLNLASCREKNGQLATAWGLFLDAERQTHTAADAPTQQLHGVAEDRAGKLEPRVSKLTINVGSPIDGLEISRGADKVAAVSWNQTLPIDGGTYTITAHAPGKMTWTAQITVGVEGDTQTVDVPELAAGAVPTPTRSPLVVPLAVGAGALVLAGVSVGFELSAESTYNQAKTETTMTVAQRESLYNSANDQRHVAQGFAVGGAIAAGAAVWLYVRSRHSEDNRTAVIATPAGIGVVGRF
jgi:hypothetical protein